MKIAVARVAPNVVTKSHGCRTTLFALRFESCVNCRQEEFGLCLGF